MRTIYIKTTILVFLFIGCKKFIEVDAPVTSTNAANVYSNDATAAAVLTGIYTQISDQDVDLTNGSLTSLSLFPALSSDELTLYNLSDTRFSPFYANDLNSLITSGVFWTSIYPIIFEANSAIEGLTNSSSLTPAVKQQLLGEAKFIRAFCYFYLVNLYGDVPLATTSDYKTNSLLIRTPKPQIYQQIIIDLKDAQNQLSSNYLKADALTVYSIGATERVRPTKWAATALLARVYLYTGDYVNSQNQASAVINDSTMYSLSSLTDAFMKNSPETIWSLQPVHTGTQSNTGDGAIFILPSTGPNTFPNLVYLSSDLVNSFEVGDMRKSTWIDSVSAGGITYYYPYKYKVSTVDTATAEYIMMLRLGEQYLIRAEAEAQQNNLAGSQSDLNVIRGRAGLPITAANDKTSLLTAILHERRVELFSEWGHRWFDLIRTNNIDAVMNIIAPTKGGSWISYKALYPIPQSEISLDTKLVQNTGY
jgi:hypothetical protein